MDTSLYDDHEDLGIDGRLLLAAREADDAGWPIRYDGPAVHSWTLAAQWAIEQPDEGDDYYQSPVVRTIKAIDQARHEHCEHKDVTHEEYFGRDEMIHHADTDTWTTKHIPGKPGIYCNNCWYTKIEDEPWINPEEMFGPVDC